MSALPWRVRRYVARAGLPGSDRELLLRQLARARAAGLEPALLVLAARLGVLCARGQLDRRVVERMIGAGR